ncbi:hypothetical protein GJV26_29720 [Massilia dura]|uniref:Uncharacterized protein n=1 Tax=Pseudoduganella dura TaxID=321982 RepID=A0A6I3XXU2_9BURK|nr:hypothetical protein [Pseudoduganella dura]MUI16605.1 hypothetical protein [Pseudoduganella dura]GGY02796.1 hypothetical protein GCM10007386_37140 [Pseudoduganella dura]
MTTVARLLDRLAESGRGLIFLVNLKDTLDSGFDAAPLREVCRELAAAMAGTPDASPTPDELVEDLGGRCVSRGFWRHSTEPLLQPNGAAPWTVLSRVTTYGRFFTSVMDRRPGAPRLAVPAPAELGAGCRSEIRPEDVPAVQDYVDSGRWKDDVDSGKVRFGGHCVWVAPQRELIRRQRHVRKPVPDYYRDIIGLSHLMPGHHLIRLDLDLDAWTGGTRVLRRRPHGACNGGPRFRMTYDGPVCSGNWGRTVNLAVVAQYRNASLNGVPEMVMEPFTVPLAAVTAQYLGEVRSKPETNDGYFLRRMTPEPIDRIVRALAEALS